jgi:hypothetical protein
MTKPPFGTAPRIGGVTVRMYTFVRSYAEGLKEVQRAQWRPTITTHEVGHVNDLQPTMHPSTQYDSCTLPPRCDIDVT